MLGIFAFLFQVFDDRGLIMQSCCYLQLGLVILAFLLYLGTFIKDRLMIKRTTEQAIRNEQSELILQQQYRATIYCAENCDDLALNTHWMDNEVNLYYYLATALEYLFVLCLIIVESLTIVYIYKNTTTVQRQEQ